MHCLKISLTQAALFARLQSLYKLEILETIAMKCSLLIIRVTFLGENFTSYRKF